MDEDFKAFLDWAAQAPDIPGDRGMGTVERHLIGEEEAYFRSMMRWSVNHVRTIAAVIRRMEQAVHQQAEPVTLRCENCSEWLDIFAIAKSQPDQLSLCDECQELHDNWRENKLTPSA